MLKQENLVFTKPKVLDPRGMNRPGTGLMVKGTSILGFDEETSIQKTLRKPNNNLKNSWTGSCESAWILRWY